MAWKYIQKRGLGISANLLNKYVKPQRPVYQKSGNFILNALNYVRDADNFQSDLSKSPSQIKVEELLTKIEERPELLYLLSNFLKELLKIGISQDERNISNFKYRMYLMWKIGKLHKDFWEACHFEEISTHNHKINLNPNDIGVLDPRNFPTEAYNQLQTGVYNKTSFKHLGI